MKTPPVHARSTIGAMLAAAAVLATGLILAFGFRLLVVRRADAERLARAESRNLALALDQNISGTLRWIDQALGSVIGLLPGSPALGGPDRSRVERFLAVEGGLLPKPGIIWVADAQGRAIMGNRDIATVPPWSGRTWFQYCRDHPEADMVVAKPIIGFYTRKWVIPCVRRFNDPDGGFAGVVVIPLSVEYLQGLLAGYDLGAAGTLTLRDGDGGFIARYPPLPQGSDRDIGIHNGSPELLAFIQSGAGEEIHLAHSTVDRVPRLYANRRIMGVPMMVGAGLAQADYLAQWRRDRIRTLAVMGLAILGVWTGAWLFHRAWRAQVRNAKALSMSEERFRYVSDSMMDIAYSCLREPDGTFGIDWMVGATATLLGRPIEEIIAGRCWGSLVVEADRPRFLANVLGLAPGESGSCELRLVRKDGGLAWFESFAQCDAAPGGGGAQRIYGALVNIGERKRAELTLRESEAKLNLVLNSTAEAIYGMDMEGRCTFYNNAFLRLTGYTAEDPLLGRNVHELIHHSYRDGTPYPAEACPTLRGVSSHAEIGADDEVFWRKDGTPFMVEYWSWLQKVDDQVVGVVVTFLDITERRKGQALQRQMELELNQMQKLDSLGKLAGGVAHDMNNVLAAIQAVTETLAVVRAQDAELVKALGTVEHAANRGRDLVRGLTNFARKEIREAELLDLNALVRDEMDILRRTTRQRVELVLDLEEALPAVIAEKGTLGSALMNLCVNALDAMPEGGALTLRTRSLPRGMIGLEVADTGAGMAPEVLSRAMEPFFTTKPVGKGTGLGLASVYATAKAHGGSVSIQSEAGVGTTVRIQLPAVPETLAAPAAPLSAQAAGPPLRILLVDDDDLIRTSMPPMLALSGHKVSTASGGAEALRQLGLGRQPDLVILDLNMPGMDGLETLREIRRRGIELPVLLATGHLEAPAEAVLAGDPNARSIVKPFTMTELDGSIRELLARGPT